MIDFVTSGRVADLIIVTMLLELGWIAARRREKLAEAVLALFPGICLALALRAALTGSAWWWVALWLTVALPAHIIDMRRRLR